MARQIGPVGGALRESDDEQFDDRLLAAVRDALHEKVTTVGYSSPPRPTSSRPAA